LKNSNIPIFGIIGGTGLYKLEGLEDCKETLIETPFGLPSAPLVSGKVGDNEVVFLPRHGVHHEFLPSEVNYRANIWALKKAGVRSIIGVSAVGSLTADLEPGALAMPSQYVDCTRGRREATFFGRGLAGHISSAEPSCKKLRERIKRVAAESNINIHDNKTYACVEGPRLGTRAESLALRKLDCDLVGMTNVPEAFLAREAQICYTTIAIVTDFDCWLEDPEQHATVKQVMELYSKNIGVIKNILKQILVEGVPASECSCRNALDGAILSNEKALSDKNLELLEFLRK